MHFLWSHAFPLWIAEAFGIGAGRQLAHPLGYLVGRWIYLLGGLAR
jgi:hypothetical protein